MTKQGEWFEKFEDVPENLHTQIAASAFPPPLEEANKLGLQKWFVMLFALKHQHLNLLFI